MLGLKRQIREERTINKLLSEDLEQLKRNLKFTQAEEKDQEIKLLRKECARMRKVVQKELQKKEWNSTNAVSLFSRVPNEEDRRQLQQVFGAKEHDLDVACQQIV